MINNSKWRFIDMKKIHQLRRPCLFFRIIISTWNVEGKLTQCIQSSAFNFFINDNYSKPQTYKQLHCRTNAVNSFSFNIIISASGSLWLIYYQLPNAALMPNIHFSFNDLLQKSVISQPIIYTILLFIYVILK